MAIMIISFFMFAYANSLGILPYELPQKSYFGRAVDFSIILLITGASIFMMFNDIKILIRNLRVKNLKLRRKEFRASYLAHYDQLTGLPNKISCVNDLTKLLQKQSMSKTVQLNDENIAFYHINIDNFKALNNSLGTNIGDSVLQELAQRYIKLLDNNCSCQIYRYSGDEFIFILSKQKQANITAFTQKILSQTALALNIKEYKIELTISIGISIAPQHGNSFDILKKNSDLALQIAKEEQGSSFSFYIPQMTTDNIDKYQMVVNLKKAIQNKEFELFYQAKVDLKTKEVIGAEALIRWHQPSLGLITPDNFIPVAEQSGLIIDIGNWVIDESCSACKNWHNLGFKDLTIAINLSAVQFKKGDLPQIIISSLQKNDLSPKYIELEITESTLINNLEYFQQQVNKLQTLGIKFTIDDFGTGYSNLSYLSKFNVANLKIDMSFVRTMCQSEQNQHIVNAIIQMSKNLTIENVAEGVEDQNTAQLLSELGCTYGQGYFWSRPLPNNDFIKYLKDHPGN
ncbi:MAG: EAL domain-containing protein [Alteromonadaceae bacterium]|nr:EAL domain-containing protein [Alteromonadaceae bacterium]